MDFSALTAGGAIPSVNPGDLRGVWEIMRETQQTAIGIDVRVLASVCSPEANVLAVWARGAMLWILAHRGLLTSRQRGNQLDDAVFDAGATYSLPGGLNGFDPDAFLEQLSSRGD